MATPSKAEPPTSGGLQSKLLLVVTGILIPLLAVGVPYIIELIVPRSSLVFETVGPIQVEGTVAFSVVVRNEGKSVERNIEVWLPTRLRPGKYRLQSSVTTTLREDSRATALAIGDLRPTEKADVSLLIEEDHVYFLWAHRMPDLRVISSETRATWAGRSEEAFFLYRAGFWGFIILLAAGFVGGLYQQYFMSRAAREKMILKEMEKLK